MKLLDLREQIGRLRFLRRIVAARAFHFVSSSVIRSKA